MHLNRNQLLADIISDRRVNVCAYSRKSQHWLIKIKYFHCAIEISNFGIFWFNHFLLSSNLRKSFTFLGLHQSDNLIWALSILFFKWNNMTHDIWHILIGSAPSKSKPKPFVQIHTFIFPVRCEVQFSSSFLPNSIEFQIGPAFNARVKSSISNYTVGN